MQEGTMVTVLQCGQYARQYDGDSAMAIQDSTIVTVRWWQDDAR